MTLPPENEPAAPARPAGWAWFLPIGFAVVGVINLLLVPDRPWYLGGWSYIVIGALWATPLLWMYRQSRRPTRGSFKR